MRCSHPRHAQVLTSFEMEAALTPACVYNKTGLRLPTKTSPQMHWCTQSECSIVCSRDPSLWVPCSNPVGIPDMILVLMGIANYSLGSSYVYARGSSASIRIPRPCLEELTLSRVLFDYNRDESNVIRYNFRNVLLHSVQNPAMLAAN